MNKYKQNSRITPFEKKVYSLCKKIPRGKVSTYKSIAEAMNTRAYRAVGNALNKNPHASEIPCHRVVKSTGEIGGFAVGTRKKAKMLKTEGIRIKDGKIIDIEKITIRKF